MLENFTPGTLPYYEALRELDPAQLAQEWREITEVEADYLLNVLPPLYMRGGCFMVSEPMTHTQHGAIFEAVVNLGARYFSRPAYRQTFNPEQYAREICARFQLEKS